MSDEELLETYRAAINKAMDEAYARDGFATNMSRESIVAGLRAVFDMSKGEKRAEEEREDVIAWLLRDFGDDNSPLGRHYTDAEIADVLRRAEGPRPITDEMVERAISAHRFTNAFGPEEVTRMRAALEAAEEARR